MSLYCRAGEKITCVRGHHVATVRRDINVGDHVSSLDFEWLMQPPQSGGRDPTCEVCGAACFAGSPWGKVAHFEDGGWRSSSGRVNGK